jgi:thiamine-monophosphate kinase
MRERDIIANYFVPLASAEPGAFALRDDAAVLDVPSGQQLVITTDSVIEGVHVLPHASPQQFAQKLMRRNLSDLAAMGAAPWRYTLNLRVPRETPDAWFAAFAQTLNDEQQQFGLVLAGGDTTLGGDHVHLTLTAMGLVDGPALTRRGAREGDIIFVSGTIGDAALGLTMLQDDAHADGPWVERYHRPQPRLALGKALRSKATSALDCSDGLWLDLQRLCDASGVGALVELEQVPLSAATRQLLDAAPDADSRSALWQMLVTGGDDYELIFTAPASMAQELQEMARFTGTSITAIGTVTEAPTLHYRDARGTHAFSLQSGWEY